MMSKEKQGIDLAANNAAGESMQAAKRPLSVRTKGLIVFVALMVYAFATALFVMHEKRALMKEFEQIEMSLETDRLLNQASTAAFHTLMGVFVNLDASDRDAGMQRIRMHFDSLLNRYAEVRARDPALGISLDGIRKAQEAAAREPSRANMNQLIAELVKTKNEFTVLAEQSHIARQHMSEQYRVKADAAMGIALFLVMIGLALLGLCIGVFFRQLTRDLSILQTRALEIVNGYRGEPIPVRRYDEVGQLMAAVNSMATALDRREKELLLERQRYFHQEKMAAIGTLAAGVAHEIGNPIAAISGIAEDMVLRRNEGPGVCASKELCLQCRPDLILEQAQRLSAITREISDFASPQPADPQFLDLNGQLRSACSLIRYDKRLRNVELRLELDSQLPAIYGEANQLTQLIMNLLINAMDALESVKGRQPTITVSTRVDSGRVCMAVEDNGHGMEKEVLAQAFDAFFTTKPAGKGTGLGLPLCYSIMKRHEGTIEIDSSPGTGTRVQAFFPIKEIS